MNCWVDGQMSGRRRSEGLATDQLAADLTLERPRCTVQHPGVGGLRSPLYGTTPLGSGATILQRSE